MIVTCPSSKEMHMRAVRSAPAGVTVVDVDEPDGAGELVKIRPASICASDLIPKYYPHLAGLAR